MCRGAQGPRGAGGVVTRSFPHLGFDPTPGDVDRTRDLARQIGNLHTELTTTVTELDRLDCGYWKGEAAKAFIAHIDHDVTPLIKKAHDSFGKASDALARWADQLYGFQAEADALEREAATKQGALDHAKTAAGMSTGSDATPGVPHPSPEASPDPDPQAAADAKKKQQAVTDASSALDGVRHRADELHNRYTAAAKAISHDLDKAGDIAPDKPGLFHRIVHGVAAAWDDTVKWVKDHADLIKFIADMLSDLSAVLGVLAIITAPFEPLGAIFAGAALATGALALVGDLVAKAAGADVSWLSIGISAMGVIPGIGVFAKGAKVAEGVNAADRALELGEGFTNVTKTGKSLLNFGDEASGLFKFAVKGKTIALWGDKTTEMIKAEGFMNRLRVVSENGFVYGQKIGVQGLKIVSGGKWVINPMSKLGQTIDSVVKIAPKIYGLPGQIQDGKNMGDRFQQSATAH